MDLLCRYWFFHRRLVAIIFAGVLFCLFATLPVFSHPTYVPVSKNPDEIQVDHSEIVGTAPLTATIYIPSLLNNYAQPFALDISDRVDVGNYYLTTYAVPTPPMAWTGDRLACNAGTTSAAYKEAIRQRINYFRAMAGILTPIIFEASLNARAQEAALMMSVNDDIEHNPPLSWLCFTPLGHSGAVSSHLTNGVHGVAAIDHLMKDPGSFNYAVGHRRNILQPEKISMGAGDVPMDANFSAISALYVSGLSTMAYPALRDGYVAWPPPGFVPHTVVYPRWSFSLDSADFTNASVSMTSNGNTLPIALELVATGYGHNTLVWIPNGMNDSDSWPLPSSDTSYTVTVSGVLVAGVSQSFTYTVTVFAAP